MLETTPWVLHPLTLTLRTHIHTLLISRVWDVARTATIKPRNY